MAQLFLIGELDIAYRRGGKRSRARIADRRRLLFTGRRYLQSRYVGTALGWIRSGTAYRLRGRHPGPQASRPAPYRTVRRRPGPRHVVNLAGRPKVLGRISVAV